MLERMHLWCAEPLRMRLYSFGQEGVQAFGLVESKDIGRQGCWIHAFLYMRMDAGELFFAKKESNVLV